LSHGKLFFPRRKEGKKKTKEDWNWMLDGDIEMELVAKAQEYNERMRARISSNEFLFIW
jgi:hypothetical protein